MSLSFVLLRSAALELSVQVVPAWVWAVMQAKETVLGRATLFRVARFLLGLLRPRRSPNQVLDRPPLRHRNLNRLVGLARLRVDASGSGLLGLSVVLAHKNLRKERLCPFLDPVEGPVPSDCLPMLRPADLIRAEDRSPRELLWPLVAQPANRVSRPALRQSRSAT